MAIPSELDRFFEKPPAGFSAEDKAREIFLRADSISQPELRFALVSDLAALGEFGVPILEKTLEGGNPEKKRLALFALGRCRDGASFPRMNGGKKDLEVESLAMLAGARLGNRESLDRALALLQSKIADPYLRLAAALAWAGAPDRSAAKGSLEALQVVWKNEDNAEIAGALSIALGRQGSEDSFGALVARLAASKDPVLRTGIWIGLTAAGATILPEAALAEMELFDPVLSPAAALALTELPTAKAQERWEKCYRLGDPGLRAAMIEGLSRSSDAKNRSILFEAVQSERDPECRRAALRAALRRHDLPMASSLRKNRAGETLGGSWALVMTMLSLEGRPAEPSESSVRLQKELTDAVTRQQDELPEGAIYWIGASGAREQEPWLRGIELQGGKFAESARASRKYLRGEMDLRAFFEEVRSRAEAAHLLPGYALRRVQISYAQALLGAGTRYFDVKKVAYPGTLAKAEKRKPRPIASDSAYFEDLWHWLESDWLLR